ncbi:MAG: InlB B-repeat-containing protein [Bacilli bacterium]|nr:InlB B-repeat-containing protein [Bacilli bacterium]
MKNRKKRNRKGFTLVELLLVLVIVGIILVLAIPGILDAIEENRTESGRTVEKILMRDLEMYNEDHKDDLWIKNDTSGCTYISFSELLTANEDIKLGECLLNNNESLTIIKNKQNKYDYYVGITCGKNIKNKGTEGDDKYVIDVSQGGSIYYQSKSHSCDGTFILQASYNGGSLVNSNGWIENTGYSTKTVTSGDPYGVFPSVEREGYTFQGWNTDPSSSGTWVTETDKTNQQIYAIYAIWLKETETTPLAFANQTIEVSYSQSAQTRNITSVSGGVGPYTFEKKAGENDITISSTGRVTIPAAKPIGSYPLTVGVTDRKGDTATGTVTVVVSDEKVNLKCPTINDYSGAYDGQSHSIVVGNDAFVGTGGRLEYKDGESGTWSTTKPTLIDVGTKTVYVRAVSGDAYYNSQDCGSKIVTISPKSIPVSWGTVLWEYDGNPHSTTATAETGVTGESMALSVSNNSITNVGTQAVTASCDSVTGGQAKCSNYTLTNTTNTLKIESLYTVNVVVVNGTVDVSSKTVARNDNATFTLTPTYPSGYSEIIVDCSNSQNGAVNSDVLTVSSVTHDTTCTVTYKLKQYSITYEKGSDSTATNMPSPTVKNYDQTVNITTSQPTSTTNAFLGWNTISSATESTGTWYDGGESYSANDDYTVYAQWFNINSLEQWYTTTVKPGDFSHVDVTSTSPNLFYPDTDQRDYYLHYSIPTQSGYDVKGVSGYYVGSQTFRVYGVDQVDLKIRALNAPTYKPASGSAVIQYFSVKHRDPITYSDAIDTRIDRIQKLQDISLTYSDVKTISKTLDNIQLDSNKSWSGTLQTIPDGWDYVSMGGYNISNATTGGTYTSRTTLTSNIVKTGENKDTIKLTAYTSTTIPKVKLTMYYIIAISSKTERDTTFAPTEYSTKGASRYKALKDLYDAKDDSFPGSYVKRYTRVESSTMTVPSGSSWGMATFTKSISIPSGKKGKILGVAAQGVTNGSQSNAFGSSFTVMNKAYLSGANSTTSATYNVIFYAGNTSSSETTGRTQTNVFAWGHPIYICSGTLTEGTENITIGTA